MKALAALKTLIVIVFCSLFFIGCSVPPPVTSASNKPSNAAQVDVQSNQKIAAGQSHNLFINSDGTVVGWGGNARGESLPNSDISSAVSVAAYKRHNLALLENGDIVNWGYSYNSMDIPSNLSNIVAMDVGGNGGFAVNNKGQLSSWGRASVIPIPSELSFVVDIAAGTNHQIALNKDGSVVAWGSNAKGQSQVPEGLTNTIGAIAVEAGDQYSLALLADGTVSAWGSNDHGQTDVPANLDNVIRISAGANHTLALKRDGTVVAWGNNTHAQTTVPSELTNVIDIAAGDQHSLALRSDHSIVTWGNPAQGQAISPDLFTESASIIEGWQTWLYDAPSMTLPSLLLDQQTNITAVQDKINSVLPSNFDLMEKLTGSSNQLLALNSQGDVFSWPDNINYDRLKTKLRNIVDIASTNSYNFALNQDGSVISWRSDNQNEDLNQISGALSQILQNITALSAQANNILALTKEGTVITVSISDSDGIQYDTTTISNAIDISSGFDYSIALTEFGTVELIGASATEDQAVPYNLEEVIAIASGKGHNIALKSDGTVALWGNNIYGAEDFIEKHQHELQDIVKISANNNLSIFTRADGSTFVWGDVYLPSDLEIDIVNFGD